VYLLNRIGCVCTALAAFSVAASASDNSQAGTAAPFCKEVNGRIVWTLLGAGPNSLAPFDPAGRVLGQSTGDLKSATTAIILNANQKPDGSATTNDLDVFVTGPGDVFWGDGAASFTPIAGRAALKDIQTITIKGGTGRWAGVTGSLSLDGEGVFLNPPAGQVVGNLIFDVAYRGRMCKTNFEDGWWQ